MNVRRQLLSNLKHYDVGDIQIGSLVSFQGTGFGIVVGIRVLQKGSLKWSTLIDVLWTHEEWVVDY